MSRRPIMLTIFIHEDLKDFDQDLFYQNNIDWLVEKIETISGRNTEFGFVLPSEAPSLCSINYKSTDLRGFVELLDTELSEYLSKPGMVQDNSINKYLLLTRDAMNPETLGVAYTPGRVGTATVNPSITAVHEFGHMFNANHEDSQAIVDTYYGLGKSLMQPSADGKVALVLSKKNQQNIRDYLDQYD